MAALTTDRDTPQRDGTLFEYPVAAAAVLFAGAMGALDTDGNAVPAAATATLKVVGRVEERADNTGGAAGDASAKLRRGVFRFANSSDADEITRADIDGTCYAADDQTVAKTDATGTRPAAGTIMDVDALGVWVRI